MSFGLRHGGQEFEQLRFFAFPQNKKKIRRERAAEKKNHAETSAVFFTRTRARKSKGPTEFSSAENAEAFFFAFPQNKKKSARDLRERKIRKKRRA